MYFLKMFGLDWSNKFAHISIFKFGQIETFYFGYF